MSTDWRKKFVSLIQFQVPSKKHINPRLQKCRKDFKAENAADAGIRTHYLQLFGKSSLHLSVISPKPSATVSD